MSNLGDGLVWYFAFLFSLCFHEGAHALAGYKLGDDTAFQGGQVSLDPRPHIKQEPFGTVVIPIFTFLSSGWMFGWASAPYDPFWAMKYPKRSALVSLAGPAANLIIVIACAVIMRVGLVFNFFESVDWMNYGEIIASTSAGLNHAFAQMLSVFFSLNILLFTFNLLPLPPLDGSGIVPFFLKEDTSQKYMEFIHNPALLMIGLFLAWNISGYIFDPIHTCFVNIMYMGVANY